MPAARPQGPRSVLSPHRSPSWRPLSAVAIGVLAADPATRPTACSPRPAPPAGRRATVDTRRHPLRRAASSATVVPLADPHRREGRAARVASAVQRRAEGRARPSRSRRRRQLWTTDDLNLWNEPGDKAKQARRARRRQEGAGHRPRRRAAAPRSSSTAQSRWVTAGYLADEKPEPEPPPASAAPAPTAASIERRHASASSTVHDARLRQRVPEITSLRHLARRRRAPQGRAIDIMISGARLGTRSRSSCAPTTPSWASSYIIYSPAHLVRGPLPARAGGRCPTVARRPPTTTTTCTSRSTDPGRSSAVRGPR